MPLAAIAALSAILAGWALFSAFGRAARAQTVAPQRHRPELVLQAAHTAEIAGLAYGPDGKLLISGSFDGNIKIWDAETGKELRTIQTGDPQVRSVALSRDGKRIFGGTNYFAVREYDVVTGRPLPGFLNHMGPVNAVAVSRDGKLVVSGSADETTKLFDAETRAVLQIFGVEKPVVHPSGTLIDNPGEIWSVAIGPGNDIVASGTEDKLINIWSIASGTKLRTLAGHTSGVRSIDFLPGARLVTSSLREVIIWDLQTGKPLHTLDSSPDDDPKRSKPDIAVSPDGATIAIVDLGGRLKLWSVQSGNEIRELVRLDNGFFDRVRFSPDGHSIAASTAFEGYGITIWDAADGSELVNFDRSWSELKRTAISSDAGTLAATLRGGKVRIWDLSGRRPPKTIEVTPGLFDLSLSPDGSLLGVAYVHSFEVWEVAAGKRVLERERGSTGGAGGHLAAFTPDNKFAVVGELDGIALVDLRTGAKLRTIQPFLTGQDGGIATSMAVDASGRFIATGNIDMTVRLWETNSGRLIRQFCRGETGASAVAISPDGKFVAAEDVFGVRICPIEGDGVMRLQDSTVTWFNGSLAFSPDSRQIAVSTPFGYVGIYDRATGKEVKSFPGTELAVAQECVVRFSADGRSLISNSRKRIKLWDIASGRERADLVSIGDDGWAVLTPEGIFDASPEAQGLMHFVIASERFGFETLSLDQLKSRYYVPGLLRKIHLGERLPATGDLSITLFPEVTVDQTAPNSAALMLRAEDRGGGIGRIEVRINGSELSSDLRRATLPGQPASRFEARIDVPRERLLPGTNLVEVVAWNTEGDVRSRSIRTRLDLADNGTISRGSGSKKSRKEKRPSEVNFYAVISGVSDYAGDALDLRYAAKDAEDVAKAISLAARRYFCGEEMSRGASCERVHVWLLSTEGDKPSQFAGLGDTPGLKRLDPVKANYAAAFAEIAERAKPEDVVFTYFSGHGTAITSEEAVRESAFPDLYLYPTRDAVTLDRSAMANRTERESKTVSSLELAKWTAAIKAEKKVMVLDTCAAGAVQKDLVAQSRSDDGSQLRSLDRLMERTGMFVLMGSAAEALSFEANVYRQGLLTYSLLDAMTVDSKLREGRFLNVETWFASAEDSVEDLARGIGGIQRPRFFKSAEAQSFDIGRIESDERRQIPMVRRVPLILPPELREKGKRTDAERLTEKLEAELIRRSFAAPRGDSGAINYVNASRAANGLTPRGEYVIDGDIITVDVSLIRDEVEIATLRVSGPREEIAAKLLTAMIEALNKLAK